MISALRRNREPEPEPGTTGAPARDRLGALGVWSREFRDVQPAEAADAAAELEELGFGTVWVPGSGGGPVLDLVDSMLAATARIVVATGILNVWMHDAGEVAARHAALQRKHRGRFLLGLGISHAEFLDTIDPGRYRKPLSEMRRYLDRLDAAAAPVPEGERVLAALGPKMLALAAQRSAGAHPYFVDVAHTRMARERLGPDRLLAPEQAVVLTPDRGEARRLAEWHVDRYLGTRNYRSNLVRLGYTDADLAGHGSDRLFDAVVAWGETGIRDRVAEHRAAGADHVCLQVVGGGEGLPRAAWRTLAATLTG